MSMYNMIHGFNPSCYLFLPMLGRPVKEYPRFRDCFLSEDKSHIEVYTRVGGNNRGQGYGETELYKDPLFVDTYDDEYDNTYGIYVFNVPEQWKEDFDKILEGRLGSVSKAYVQLIKDFYPKLAENGEIDRLFKEF